MLQRWAIATHACVVHCTPKVLNFSLRLPTSLPAQEHCKKTSPPPRGRASALSLLLSLSHCISATYSLLHPTLEHHFPINTSHTNGYQIHNGLHTHATTRKNLRSSNAFGSVPFFVLYHAFHAQNGLLFPDLLRPLQLIFYSPRCPTSLRQPTPPPQKKELTFWSFIFNSLFFASQINLT